jgi:hypothetical protein
MTQEPDHSEQNSPEVLTELSSEPEAAAIVTALSERGIEANIVGGFTAGFIAEAPGYVRVLVKQRDLEAAKAALEEIVIEHDNIDWSKVDVGDPEDE